MTISGIESSFDVNNTQRTYGNRVLSKNFNIPIEEINSGSKVNAPLQAVSNPETGESIEIYQSDVYSEDSPIYIVKGKTAEGEEFERKLNACIIDTRNCSLAEIMVLNAEVGNTSNADKQRAEIVFKQTGAENYLDKADYSTAMKEVLDDYSKAGNWDSYLSMDKWQQDIKDYTSVQVNFDRGIMQRNGISTDSCSFATLRSIEDIQKEWNDRIIEAAKNNKTSMRDVLKQNHPNAENMKWGFVGSDVEMTFDEFVKYMEDENRKWLQSNKDWLEEKGLWDYVK